MTSIKSFCSLAADEAVAQFRRNPERFISMLNGIIQTLSNIPQSVTEMLKCILEGLCLNDAGLKSKYQISMLNGIIQTLSNIPQSVTEMLKCILEGLCLNDAGLKSKYQNKCQDLKEAAEHLLTYIGHVEGLLTLGRNEERKRRINAELTWQEQSHDASCFRELKAFFEELKSRLKEADDVLSDVEKRCEVVKAECQKASVESEKLETKAWKGKIIARGVAGTGGVVSVGALGGMLAACGFCAVTMATGGLALGAAGVGAGVAYVSYKVSGKYAEKEKAFENGKTNFQKLCKTSSAIEDLGRKIKVQSGSSSVEREMTFVSTSCFASTAMNALEQLYTQMGKYEKIQVQRASTQDIIQKLQSCIMNA